MKRTAAAIAFALALTLPAAAEPQSLGAFSDWSVFKSSGSDGVVCYALSQPKESLPTNVKRDPIYFLISTWPGKRPSANRRSSRAIPTRTAASRRLKSAPTNSSSTRRMKAPTAAPG